MPLRVVFFGTPDFAAHILQCIHTSSHQIVGVVTVPERASGRGQKITSSAVAHTARQLNLPLIQPEKLRDPDFHHILKSWNADVFVVVAFRMMPRIVWDMPPLGTFNLHASLLPDYRGAAPINYALINGETTTGVSTFFLNDRIDEGEILLQSSTPIAPNEDAGSLHDRLMYLGGDLVVQTLDRLLKKDLYPSPQPKAPNEKTAHKIFKADTKINWDWPLTRLHNFVRGLSPYPAAFTTLRMGTEQKSLKIFRGRPEYGKGSASPQLIQDENHLYIHHPEGKFYLEEVQLEGKKRMSTPDFLRGLNHTISLT